MAALAGRAARMLASWPGRLLTGAAALAGVGLALLVTFQERLIYLPRVPGVPDEFPFYPDRFGLEYEDVWLTAADGVKLHAWLLRAPGAAAAAAAAGARLPALVFFQENAGNMAMRLPFLRALVLNLGCAVLAPSYRGYGLSEGRPSEAGLKLDAQAAVDHALSRDDVDPGRVAVFGRSLGGAVALAVAAANADRLAATVVENTFLSIEDVAPRLLPVLSPFLGEGRPLNCLVRDKWRNAAPARALRGKRVLLLSSLQDEMLPPEHMRRLWAELSGGDDVAACARGAAWVEFPDGRHLDAYDACAARYWPALATFAAEAGFAGPGVGRGLGAAR